MGVLTRLRWSRTDHLIAHAVLLVAMAGAALTALVGLVWLTPLLSPDAAGPINTVEVSRTEGAPQAVVDAGATAADVTVADTGRMVLVFEDPTTFERLLLAAPGLLGVAATLVVLLMLHGLLRSLDRGDPFVAANVRRVYTIASAVLVASLAVPLLGSLCDGLLRARALGAGEFVLTVAHSGGGISVPLVLTGFLLGALAEVFRRGTHLRADVEGLV